MWIGKECELDWNSVSDNEKEEKTEDDTVVFGISLDSTDARIQDASNGCDHTDSDDSEVNDQDVHTNYFNLNTAGGNTSTNLNFANDRFPLIFFDTLIPNVTKKIVEMVTSKFASRDFELDVDDHNYATPFAMKELDSLMSDLQGNLLAPESVDLANTVNQGPSVDSENENSDCSEIQSNLMHEEDVNNEPAVEESPGIPCSLLGLKSVDKSQSCSEHKFKNDGENTSCTISCCVCRESCVDFDGLENHMKCHTSLQPKLCLPSLTSIEIEKGIGNWKHKMALTSDNEIEEKLDKWQQGKSYESEDSNIVKENASNYNIEVAPKPNSYCPPNKERSVESRKTVKRKVERQFDHHPDDPPLQSEEPRSKKSHKMSSNEDESSGEFQEMNSSEQSDHAVDLENSGTDRVSSKSTTPPRSHSRSRLKTRRRYTKINSPCSGRLQKTVENMVDVSSDTSSSDGLNSSLSRNPFRIEKPTRNSSRMGLLNNREVRREEHITKTVPKTSGVQYKKQDDPIYPCPICECYYTNVWKFTEHMENLHKIKKEGESENSQKRKKVSRDDGKFICKERRFECYICSDVFMYEDSLEKHMEGHREHNNFGRRPRNVRHGSNSDESVLTRSPPFNVNQQYFGDKTIPQKQDSDVFYPSNRPNRIVLRHVKNNVYVMQNQNHLFEDQQTFLNPSVETEPTEEQDENIRTTSFERFGQSTEVPKNNLSKQSCDKTIPNTSSRSNFDTLVDEIREPQNVSQVESGFDLHVQKPRPVPVAHCSGERFTKISNKSPTYATILSKSSNQRARKYQHQEKESRETSQELLITRKARRLSNSSPAVAKVPSEPSNERARKFQHKSKEISEISQKPLISKKARGLPNSNQTIAKVLSEPSKERARKFQRKSKEISEISQKPLISKKARRLSNSSPAVPNVLSKTSNEQTRKFQHKEKEISKISHEPLSSKKITALSNVLSRSSNERTRKFQHNEKEIGQISEEPLSSKKVTGLLNRPNSPAVANVPSESSNGRKTKFHHNEKEISKISEVSPSTKKVTSLSNVLQAGTENKDANNSPGKQLVPVVHKIKLSQDLDVSEKPLDCLYCPRVFPTVQGLERHMEILHRHFGKGHKSKSNKNDSNPDSELHSREYSSVEDRHTKKPKPGGAENVKDLLTTLQSTDRSTAEKPELKKRNLTSASLETSDTNKLQSRVPDEACSKKENVKKQKLVISNKVVHMCPTCKRIFKNSLGLRIHTSKNRCETKTFTCNICHQTFNYPSVLKNHMSVHSKQFKCVFCFKTYNNTETLRSHYSREHKEIRLV